MKQKIETKNLRNQMKVFVRQLKKYDEELC